jgi:hypothetical protein
MSGPFRTCIDEALTKGEIDEVAAEMAREAYDDAYASASDTFGPVEADRFAASATMRKLEAEAIEARRRRQLTIRTRRKLLEDIAGLKERRGYSGVRALGGGGGKPPKDGWVQGGQPGDEGPGSRGAVAAKALELIVENLPGRAGKPGASIEGRYRVLRGNADAMMADLIERFESRTGFDRPGRAVSANLIREAFGEDTGDLAAKGLAQSWRETAEWARQAFNAAGGSLGKLEDWGLPQRHDAVRVRGVGREAWVEAVLPRLNRDKMIDKATGQPFSERRLRAVLGEVWTSISTAGVSRRQPGEHLGRGMLARAREHERFLVFRSADDWRAYQVEFGEADVFEAMMGHIDDLLRDVAQMEILGPNPVAQFEWLSRFALREAALEQAAGKEGAVDRARGHVLTAENMLAHFTGDANAPVNTKLSAFGVATRAYLTGVSLGSAILSDLPSAPYFGVMARSFSGLSRTGDMGAFVRLLADPAERAIARRSGFIIEQATDGFIRATHDNLRLISVGERANAGTSAFARRLPAATMRLQLLTPYVAARKRAFRFEFMARLHDVRDRSLADLRAGDEGDQTLASWMEARGFTEQEWSIIRAAPTWSPRPGAAFLRPLDVADRELAARLAEGVELETRFLSPETTLWTRAKLVGRDRPGTVGGEIRRSWAMFRGFTVTASHLFAEEFALRGHRGAPFAGPAMVAMHAAGAIIWLTLAGAASIQLRELRNGNDPRPMADWRFWGAAMMQGGGMGIFGDFLYAAQARNGQSAPAVAYGPGGQLVADAGRLTLGNVQQIAAGLDDGEDMGEAVAGADIGRDLVEVGQRYVPLASLWWNRTAFQRLVADQLQLALDPEAEELFERRARRMERDTGQGQWWARGEMAPERAPDWSTAAATAVEAQD